MGSASDTDENLARDQKLLAAIGGVTRDSGHASMALQQLIETVSGTGLIYFILRDAPLGQQLKQVRMMVEQAATNEFIQHPEVDPEVRDLILGILKAMQPLVELRNRVVHDIWSPAPAPERPDAISGIRATRWGREAAQSSVRTFRILARTFFLVAVTIGVAERTLVDLRRGAVDEWHSRDEVLRELKRRHRELTERVAGIKAGNLDGWHWESIPIGGAKSSQP